MQSPQIFLTRKSIVNYNFDTVNNLKLLHCNHILTFLHSIVSCNHFNAVIVKALNCNIVIKTFPLINLALGNCDIYSVPNYLV